MPAVDLGARATVVWPSAPVDGPYTLAVRKPDGTALTPAPEVDGDQEPVQAQFVPPMPGRYLLTWSVEGEATHTDILDVWPEDPRFIISVDDAAVGLNAKGKASADYLDDLRLYVAAATPVIEDIVGPVVPTAETETIDGGRTAIVLPKVPESIISVTVNGEPVENYYCQYGILYCGTRGYPTAFGWGEVTITYRVGKAVIPPNIRLATRELVRHWVQIGKHAVGGSRPDPGDGDEFTPSGFAVPRRVIELCTPHERMGAFG